MEDIDQTPLGMFRTSAKHVTAIALVACALFVLIAGYYSGKAQSSYSSYLSASYSASTYLEHYQSASSSASLCTAVASICGAVSGISILAWVGANLHIASKKTKLRCQASVPVELEGCDESVAPLIGSEVILKEYDGAVVATTKDGVSVGSLNAELAKRFVDTDAPEPVNAFVVAYHGSNPVIEVAESI